MTNHESINPSFSSEHTLFLDNVLNLKVVWLDLGLRTVACYIGLYYFFNNIIKCAFVLEQTNSVGLNN